MDTKETSNLRARAILCMGVFTCSMSSIFFKYMNAPSMVAATYRLGWTVLLLTPLVFWKAETRKELFSLKGKDFAFCGLAGIFLAFHFMVWFESLNLTSVASSTVLVNTEVIFAAFGYLLFFKKKIKGTEAAAIAVAFFGSILIATADNSGGESALLGDLCAAAAALLSACYTLIGTRQRSHISTTVYTYVLYWGSFLALLFMDLVTGTRLTGYEPINWAMSLCLAVFCTLLGHSVFSWSLKYLTPTYVSTVKLAGPVFASVLAFFLFGEVPGTVQIVGAIVVLTGVYLYTREPKTKK